MTQRRQGTQTAREHADLHRMASNGDTWPAYTTVQGVALRMLADSLDEPDTEATAPCPSKFDGEAGKQDSVAAHPPNTEEVRKRRLELVGPPETAMLLCPAPRVHFCTRSTVQP